MIKIGQRRRSTQSSSKRSVSSQIRSVRKTFPPTSGLDRILQDELNRNQAYLALNTGHGRRPHPHHRQARRHGRDRRQRDNRAQGTAARACRRSAASSWPNRRRRSRTSTSSPKGWNIPNVYIKDADKLFREYNTIVFKLEANLTDYTLDRASPEDVRDAIRLARRTGAARRSENDQAAGHSAKCVKKDSIAYGSKAANLGEMLHARVTGITIPTDFRCRITGTTSS